MKIKQKAFSFLLCISTLFPMSIYASTNETVETKLLNTKISESNLSNLNKSELKTIEKENFQTEKTDVSLNSLNKSLKKELNQTDVELNQIGESYYKKEEFNQLSPKEKILKLEKMEEIDIQKKKEEIERKAQEEKEKAEAALQAEQLEQEQLQAEQTQKEAVRVVIANDGSSNYQYDSFLNGDTITIPEGLGSVHTYMGWQLITAPDSRQYQLREQAGMNFDSEGFGIIDGRYVIACTTTFGEVGDYIDFYQEDGSIIPCIIGDIKSQGDAGCTIWGHQYGTCIVEFVVDYNSWYGGHSNPGTSNCHPEWNQNLTKAVKGGNWFYN